MSNGNRNYLAARERLIAFLQTEGYKAHPNEVFCPSGKHCWVDVAALRGQDYWAFEYKSRTDSIRRGLEQCCSYAKAFNYVVLVADRYRVTSSPYFSHFRQRGFGVWRHDGARFYPLLHPRRRIVLRDLRVVIERQFSRVLPGPNEEIITPLSSWLEPFSRLKASSSTQLSDPVPR